jgi:hypothetical protein
MIFSRRIVSVAFENVNRQNCDLFMKLPCLTALSFCLGCTTFASAQGIPQFSTHSQLNHISQLQQDQVPTLIVPADVKQNLITTNTNGITNDPLTLLCRIQLKSLESQLKPLLGLSWPAFIKDEDLRCGNDCQKHVAWRSQALAKMLPHK